MSDHERLKEIFSQALSLREPTERDAYLADACRGDQALKEQVESLIAAAGEAGDFLEQTVQIGPSPGGIERVGSVIGRYRLLQEIGQGGFGVVYMAEQVEPVRRVVALKIIKAGMDTREVIARFEAERQALALMDHPNIARVLDADTTATGRPYFVMELVRGAPITEYCDTEQLGNRERLELFLQVCHAVAHAHQKGIIHRDLKPGNVLVTLHDGRPVCKVIDFGIAKALNMNLTARTLFTEFGQFIGTPEYMSPEQAALSGLDVDTRSDVYSLGALLYELLTGHKLIDPAWLRSMSYLELERVIREEEPARPSCRVSTKGPESTMAARKRGLLPDQLVRGLRGEPDWMVMKALAKDRTRRYQSAEALANDIEHYLHAEPVSAGPPTATYRLGKFLRRHRRIAVLVSTALAALVVGGTAAMVGFIRAERAERAAREEAQLNELDASAMRALLEVKEDLYIDRVHSLLALQRKVSVGHPARLAVRLVDKLSFLRALEWLEGDPASWKPGILLREIEPEAISLLLRPETVGASASEDSALVKAVDWMADDAQRRRTESLLPLVRKSLELRIHRGDADSTLGGARQRLAETLSQEAARLLAAKRPAEARPLLEESRQRWTKILPGRNPGLCVSEGRLGACLMELGEYQRAESLLLGAWRDLNSREELLRLIDLYRREGRDDLAHSYADSMLVQEVRDLGSLPMAPGIGSRELATSGHVRGRWAWLFGQTGFMINNEGRSKVNLRPNSWCWASADDTATGLVFEWAVDEHGYPRQLIPFTSDEEAQMSSDGNLEIDLVPGSLIDDPARHRALLVYTKSAGAKNQWAHRELGSSIAVWTDPGGLPERLRVRPGSPEATLLFQGDEPPYDQAGVVVRDTLYLYGMRSNFCVYSVFVARAPINRALERDAWRFYAGANHWSEDWKQAAEIMLASRSLSVHWNPHLRKYLSVSSLNFSNQVEIRTADRPEGPWSRAFVIDTVVMPAIPQSTNSRAVGHPELAQDNGRIEILTYRRPTGDFNDEIRLLEIVLR